MGPRVRGDDDRAVMKSHPGLAVIRRAARMLWRTLLLTLLLPGAVTAVEAAGSRAEQAVVAGIMTGDAADHRALQATPGLGVTGRNHEGGGE